MVYYNIDRYSYFVLGEFCFVGENLTSSMTEGHMNGFLRTVRIRGHVRVYGIKLMFSGPK